MRFKLLETFQQNLRLETILKNITDFASQLLISCANYFCDFQSSKIQIPKELNFPFQHK